MVYGRTIPGWHGNPNTRKRCNGFKPEADMRTSLCSTRSIPNKELCKRLGLEECGRQNRLIGSLAIDPFGLAGHQADSQEPKTEAIRSGYEMWRAVTAV